MSILSPGVVPMGVANQRGLGVTNLPSSFFFGRDRRQFAIGTLIDRYCLRFASFAVCGR